MITTLIFDFGGVLINLDRQRCIDAFHKLGLKEIDQLLDKYAQSGIFAQLENGDISPDEFRQGLRELIGEPVTDKEIDNALFEFVLDIPREKLELLRRLRKEYRVLMLSNNNAIHFPYCVREKMCYDGLTLNDFFDQCYLSFEINISKPHPEIFQFLLEKEQISPEECLFFDDSEKNIEVAKSLGFNTILVPEFAPVDFLIKNLPKPLQE